MSIRYLHGVQVFLNTMELYDLRLSAIDYIGLVIYCVRNDICEVYVKKGPILRVRHLGTLAAPLIPNRSVSHPVKPVGHNKNKGK